MADELVFKQFDSVSDHSDHDYTGDGHSCINDNRVYKNIMREWKILEENLPDGIYVRTYETRVDLLRAVIIGVADTPYEDGLFFFDIKFPPDYPNHPPLVTFRSHGLVLNPVLKSGGAICLSLLNTWIGWRSERWDSSKSTILQVLVSIQALVLNDKPYCNDPERLGIDSLERIPFLGELVRREHEMYNASAFILTCQLTLYLLENPPKNFESFIAQHFRKRGSGILLRACSLVKGYRSMRLLYPKLIRSFKHIGWVEEEKLLLKFEEEDKWLFWKVVPCWFVMHFLAYMLIYHGCKMISVWRS